MANWQAGAAFTNSFLNTIQGLTALQNAQMQNARLQQQMQREQEYENVVSEETKKAKGLDLTQAIGQGLNFQDVQNAEGGTITAQQQREALQGALQNPNLTNEERTAALQGYAGTDLAVPKEKGGLDLAGLKAYQSAGGETKFNQLGREALGSDVNRSVRQRMLETGNIYGQEQALRMGKLTREDEAAQAEMDFSNWMMEETKKIQADPTKWVQDNLTGYNKAGKGSFLNDGMTGKVTMSADGKTSSFVQMDKKGKVVASTPITAETAMQGLQAMAFDRFKSMPGKFKEAFTMGIEQEKLGETKRHNRAVEGIYGVRAGGGGGKASAALNDKVNTYADMLMGSGQLNPKTNQPFNKAEAKQYAMAVVLRDTGILGTNKAGGEVKSLGDGLISIGGVPHQQNPKTMEYEPITIKGQDKYTKGLNAEGVDKTRPGTAAPAASQQAIPSNNLSYGERLRVAGRGVSSELARAEALYSQLIAERNASDDPGVYEDDIKNVERSIGLLRKRLPQ